jgi:hypothetical protein
MTENEARTFQTRRLTEYCLLAIVRLNAMIPPQTLFARLVVGIETLLRGRRALRELQFAKYNIAPRLGKRVVQERLLRRFKS